MPTSISLSLITNIHRARRTTPVAADDLLPTATLGDVLVSNGLTVWRTWSGTIAGLPVTAITALRVRLTDPEERGQCASPTNPQKAAVKG